jgi:hypothetical protein
MPKRFIWPGNIHKEEGKYFDALKNYNECLKRDQSKAEYFLGRGEVLWLPGHTGMHITISP